MMERESENKRWARLPWKWEIRKIERRIKKSENERGKGMMGLILSIKLMLSKAKRMWAYGADVMLNNDIASYTPYPASSVHHKRLQTDTVYHTPLSMAVHHTHILRWLWTIQSWWYINGFNTVYQIRCIISRELFSFIRLFIIYFLLLHRDC